jgi:hypothetical protein
LDTFGSREELLRASAFRECLQVDAQLLEGSHPRDKHQNIEKEMLERKCPKAQLMTTY